MRVDGRRTKKLVVAFHFQLSNQTGWKCDDCRKNGLEIKRRCGWLSDAAKTPERIVWARRGVSSTVCPKSSVTAESLQWIEAYSAWKTLGVCDGPMTARQVDAFSLLENELRNETRHEREGN